MGNANLVQIPNDVHAQQSIRANKDQSLAIPSSLNISGPKRPVTAQASGYQFVKSLGSGGFADVSVFHDPSTKLLFVEKTVSSKASDKARAQDLLNREVRLINTLCGNGLGDVVPAWADYGSTPNGGIRTEYVQGDFEAQVKAGLSFEEVKIIFPKICKIFERLHALEVYHGDLKPDSFRTTESGGLKLVDLNLCTWNEPLSKDSINFSRECEKKVQKDSLRGTIALMAPEQRDGATADALIDVYHLGQLLFRLCAKGNCPDQVQLPKLPKEFAIWDPLYRRCMNGKSQRKDRPNSVKKLREEFEEICKPQTKQSKQAPSAAAPTTSQTAPGANATKHPNIFLRTLQKLTGMPGRIVCSVLDTKKTDDVDAARVVSRYRMVQHIGLKPSKTIRHLYLCYREIPLLSELSRHISSVDRISDLDLAFICRKMPWGLDWGHIAKDSVPRPRDPVQERMRALGIDHQLHPEFQYLDLTTVLLALGKVDKIYLPNSFRGLGQALCKDIQKSTEWSELGNNYKSHVKHFIMRVTHDALKKQGYYL